MVSLVNLGQENLFLLVSYFLGLFARVLAVNLMFDMHSEYGWEAMKEGKQVSTVKGLRQLFPGQVRNLYSRS